MTRVSPIARFVPLATIQITETIITDQRVATSVLPDITHLLPDLQDALSAQLTILPMEIREQRLAR